MSELDEARVRSVLFNDVTRAYAGTWLPLGERQALADYLWDRGWRREVRPEDVTPAWDRLSGVALWLDRRGWGP